MDESLCAGRFVQPIDILGDGENFAMLTLQPGQGEMGRIGRA